MESLVFFAYVIGRQLIEKILRKDLGDIPIWRKRWISQFMQFVLIVLILLILFIVNN